MGLEQYITSMSIYSSLESISDRCTVQMFVPSDSPDYALIPQIEDTFNVNAVINDVETLSFRGVIREVEQEKSEGGYTFTLHLYDKAVVLLETHFRSSQRAATGFFAILGGGAPQFLSAMSVVASLQTAVGSSVGLVWNLQNYDFKETVSYDSDVATVLKNMGEFASPTEIQKVVIYYDGSVSDRVIIDIADLWKTRISDAVQLDVNDRRILNISIGETALPEIHKAFITGASGSGIIGNEFMGGVTQASISPFRTRQEQVTSVITEDREANLKTVINTTLRLDELGRASSTVVVTSAGPIGGMLVQLQRETTDYTYTAYSNRIEKEIYTLVVPTLEGDVLRHKLKLKISTTYSYSVNRLLSKVSETQEYDTDGAVVLSKAKKHVTTYTELAKGLTRRREDSYVANIVSDVFSEQSPSKLKISEQSPFKLKTSTIETYFGSPPEASTEEFGAANKTSVLRQEITISSNQYAENFEFSNPHLYRGVDFSRIANQIREMNQARRLDISVSMIGTPDIKKGGRYSIQDFRPGKSGLLNFVALGVNHSLNAGLSFMTSVEGVCYEANP